MNHVVFEKPRIPWVEQRDVHTMCGQVLLIGKQLDFSASGRVECHRVGGEQHFHRWALLAQTFSSDWLARCDSIARGTVCSAVRVGKRPLQAIALSATGVIVLLSSTSDRNHEFHMREYV